MTYGFAGNTKPWLDTSHDWAISIKGCTLLRRDRKDRRGGAICLYMRKTIKACEREDISTEDGVCGAGGSLR